MKRHLFSKYIIVNPDSASGPPSLNQWMIGCQSMYDDAVGFTQHSIVISFCGCEIPGIIIKSPEFKLRL